MSKYNARPVEIDGIRFASTAEGKRYRELKLLEAAGKIGDLQLQVKHVLVKPFKHAGRKYQGVAYVSDFEYIDLATSERIVEDVKGVITSVYRIKRALLLTQNPWINFIEVKA